VAASIHEAHLRSVAIQRTVDGGHTWVKRAAKTPTDLTDVFFVDEPIEAIRTRESDYLADKRALTLLD
jgi:hypothetical protein